MTKIKLTKEIKYSFDGFKVETYEPGEHEVADEVAVYAAKVGALEGMDTIESNKKKPGKNKAEAKAPLNKSDV
jgi:hypothetical protein